MTCRLCKGELTVIVNGEDEIDCPACEGTGELGPHIAGCPIHLVESTESPTGVDEIIIGGMVVARRCTEAGMTSFLGPGAVDWWRRIAAEIEAGRV